MRARKRGIQTGTQTGTQSLENGHKEEPLTNKKEISPSKKNPLDWPTDAFEQFYSDYPKKVEKVAARRAFDKLQVSGSVGFAQLIAARDRYAEKVRGADQQFTKGPAVWINKGCYLDEYPAATTAVQIKTRDPQTFSDDEWRDRLRENTKAGTWSTLWGPPPGSPGCIAPAHLVSATRGASHG
jgi:hypothetical protein